MISPTAGMREYALAKTGALLGDAVAVITHAAHTPDEDAVHKMRVAIRRLQQAIRLFQQYLDRNGVKDVKARMSAIMEAAGELRNRDIAIELVSDSGGNCDALQQQRLACQKRLEGVLKPYVKQDLARSWSGKLGLDVPV